MKQLICIFIAIILNPIIVLSQNKEQKTPYSSGEKLKYSLFYGLIEGGEAVITVHETAEGQFHAKATAKTVGVVRWFLDLNDIYESYFDPITCKPTKAIRNIKENKYKYYDEVFYDHVNHTVTSKKHGKMQVPEHIYDIVSSLYQMRKNEFRTMKTNDTLTVTIFFADEIYPFSVIYKGKDKITTKIGTYAALKFQPVVEVGRVFKKEDDVLFWVSDDENLLPLRAEFNVLIGSIKCDLIEYAGSKTPLVPVKK